MAQTALYLFTAFSIGRVHELFPVLAQARIVLVLGAACLLLALLTSPPARHHLWRQREVRILYALGALAVLWLPFAVWPGGSWNFLADSYSRLLVFFSLVVALAISPRVVRNLLWSVLVGIGLLGLFTIAGGSVKTGVGYASGRFYASATYDPNDVAMMAVVTLPLAVFAAAARRGVPRLLAAGVAVICVVAAILTVSRGGFIGLAFTSLLLVFRSGLAPALRILTLGVGVALLAVAVPSHYWDVMSTIWSPTGGEYLESGVWSRVELWMKGLGLFMQKPLMGVGIGMYHEAAGLTWGQWTTVHNSFLQLATELGILGFALFLALLVLSVQNARRAQRAAKDDAALRELGWMAAAVELALYSYMVVGFGLSQAYSPMLYFLLGVATALRLQVERRRGPEATGTPAPVPLPARRAAP